MDQRRGDVPPEGDESEVVDENSGEEFQRYIASQIRCSRILRGFSQLELAEMAGIDQAQISQFENRRVLPKMNTFYKLIRALDINPSEFFSDFHRVGRKREGQADASIDIVARGLSQKIRKATRNDDLTRDLWLEYERSGGRKTTLLSSLLVKVFFQPNFKKNIRHVNELGEYQKFLVGELIGFMLDDTGGSSCLTTSERVDDA